MQQIKVAESGGIILVEGLKEVLLLGQVVGHNSTLEGKETYCRMLKCRNLKIIF